MKRLLRILRRILRRIFKPSTNDLRDIAGGH